MKTAIIGSRNLTVTDFSPYLPEGTDEIVSGGAKGIDRAAKAFALANHLRYTEFLPDYARYKRGAPLKRNLEIIEYADCVLAFWDGQSHGTRFVIEKCREIGKPVDVFVIDEN